MVTKSAFDYQQTLTLNTQCTERFLSIFVEKAIAK